MPNETLTGVKVEFNGEEREITVSLEALFEYEAITGRKPLKGELDPASLADMIPLLAVCLRKDDKTITVDRIKSLPPAEFRRLHEALVQAIVLAFPASEKTSDPLAVKPQDG